jgi:hypothetical protein
MRLRTQFGGWMCTLGLSVALVLACAIAPAALGAKGARRAGAARAARAAAAQHRPPNPAPPSHPAPSHAAAPQTHADRPPNAGHGGAPTNQAHPNNFAPPSGNANGARVATPPPNVQERWRNMSPQDRQRALQNEDRLKRMTPAQQEVLRDRAQVWNRMTPEQREHVRTDVLPRWRQMPPERKQAIRQRLRVLQNMPESARNQRLGDPNFTRGMSDEDRSTLRDLSHLHVGGAPEPPGE